MSILRVDDGACVTARAFVKWAGGKQATADSLAARFPRHETYYEPFLGGGSVFFSLEPSRAILGDSNAWLIDSYRAIRDDWRAVAQILDGMKNTRANYHRVREICPDGLTLTERAAHFIFLNKTCFRGLFRVNRRGEFNVPYGDYQRRFYNAENLAAVASALSGVELRCGDFELILRDAGSQDFVYFDPPYYRVGGYSDFNRYTPTQFRTADHIRLAAVCRELDARGVRWAQSNSDTPLVRALYEGFGVATVAARREINLTASARNITELVITNYD